MMEATVDEILKKLLLFLFTQFVKVAEDNDDAELRNRDDNNLEEGEQEG